MQKSAPYTVTFGITMLRCQAKSKRSGNQCLKAAMKGKAVCRTHGGASTGPRTPTGRQKCAEVKTMHGRETRGIRAMRDVKLRELRYLERFMRSEGTLGRVDDARLKIKVFILGINSFYIIAGVLELLQLGVWPLN